MDRKKIVQKLDRLHQVAFIEKYGVENYCYICGQYKPIARGHFIKRDYLRFRWDDRNVKPLCIDCNREDDLVEYERLLVDEYSQEEIDKMKREKKIKVTSDFLQEEIERLKNGMD